MSAQDFGNGLVLLLLFAGVAVLWQVALRPAARANPPPARLAEWSIPLSDFLGFLVAALFGGFGGGLIGTALLTFRSLGADAKVAFLTGCSHLGTLGGLALFKSMVEPARPTAFSLRWRDWREGALTFLAALPIVALVAVGWRAVITKCGLPLEPQELVGVFQRARSPVLFGLMVILATVTAPLVEELVFRAGMFRYARTRLPRWGALLLPACVFAALHLSLASFVPLAVLGAIFSLAYERTGRIATSIIAHGFFNLLAVVQVLTGTGN